MTPYFITIFAVALVSASVDKYRSQIGNTPKMNEKLRRNAQFMMILTILILSLVAGLRYRVGTDYVAYALSFRGLIDNIWPNLLKFREPGLGILAWLATLIYDDYVAVFLLVSVVTISLNIKTIDRYSDNFFFSVMLYIFIGAWHGSFNGIRQYLAAAVLFAGHKYMYERKFWKYLLVVLAASLFHLTALIMLPVYFFVNRKIDFKNILLIVAVGIILRFSYDYLFDIMGIIKGSDQTEYTYMQQDVNFLRILVAFAPLVLMLMARKNFFDDPENSFYCSLLLLNATFMFATSGSAYLARVGIYTDIYATLAFPKILRLFKDRERQLAMIIVLVLYGLFWFYEVYSRNSLNNFQWVFNR